MSDKKSVWETLSTIDLGHKLKAIQGNRYLAWFDVKNELKKHYPTYREVVELTPEGLPYFASEVGLFVNVAVIIEDQVEREIYPVLDSANRALKLQPYTYTTKKGQRTVQAATSFDINTAIKRAYVKCVAGHGLGAYVFQDLPTAEVETVSSAQMQEIMDTIKKRGLILADVCKAWNINKIAQLHEVNFEPFMLWLESQA